MHKSKHIINVLLTGMILLVATATIGCASMPQTLAEVQPVTVAKCQTRPVNIEVLLHEDNTKFGSKHPFGQMAGYTLMMLTPWPVTSFDFTGVVLDVNKLDDPDSIYNQAFIKNGRLERLGRVVIFCGTPMLAEYLNQSGMAKNIYLQGELYSGDLNSVLYPRGKASEPDIIVQLVLNKLDSRSVQTFYCTTIVGMACSGGILYGSKDSYDWSFDLVARDATTGNIVCRKTYEDSYSKYTPFCTMAYHHFLKGVGPALHAAFGDFVNELDKTLPTATDRQYWDAVAARRKPRN